MTTKLLLAVSLTFFQCVSFSQEPTSYIWWDPSKNNFTVIEGQAWPKELKDPYDRLPARAEKTVRKAVWL